ncbi:hypothetical protein Tco_0745110 [Tanacetum coccineum]
MVEEAYSVVEDHPAEVTMMPKFDMSCHEPTMSSKDVKSLALRHGIPLDLHPCASSEGWTIDQLPEEVIGAADRVFRETFSGMKGWKKGSSFWIRGPFRMLCLRDIVPDDDFSILDVQKLTKRFIDLRPVPIGLLFRGGLATTWDFPGFHPIFEDTKGNVIIMFEYLCFPFFPIKLFQKKTDFQREVEVEDPKIVAARERKARAAAKRKESRKRVGDEGEGSKPKTKRKKVPAVRKGGSASSKNGSSLNPLRTVRPTDNVVGNLSNTGTKADDLWLESFVNQYGRDLNADKTKVFLSSLAGHSTHHSPAARKILSQPRTILHGESSHSQDVYVPKWAIPRRCMLTLYWCRRAYSLARWAMAQADILERFENLQDDYTKLEPRLIGNALILSGKLYTARQELEHN